MIKKYTIIILSLIVLFAAILRFWELGSLVPLEEDEVAWGYNAYSIGVDGKDEFGRFLPHDYLESFGDFKPPVYVYLDIIPVKILGLNAFSVRLPSAVFGVLTVLITFFLVKRLFSTSPKKIEYALLSSLILAISPWHIMLSRAAFEANIATFFISMGFWLFLVSIQDKKWYLILSVVSFILAIYTFNSPRIVVPLFVVSLAIGYYKKLLTIKRSVIISLIIAILFLLPTVPFLLSPNASLRFKEVNIFSNLDIVKASNEQVKEDNNSNIGKFLHNRRFAYAHEYLKHYFDNLNPNFLFLEGDNNPRFSIQSVGQMYLWDSIFFFLGILYLFKLREKNGWILPIWILLGIIPAATARETPHALRIETTLPAFQILVAYGFVNGVDEIKGTIKKIPLKTIAISLASVLLFGNMFYFLHDYFNHYPKRFSAQWSYGYKEAFAYAKVNESTYTSIYFPQELGRPYIYYLFYSQYSPSDFRQNAKITKDIFGFVKVEKIGKYEFPDSLPGISKGNLYITSFTNDNEYKDKIPAYAHVLKTIYRLDGHIGLALYTL